METQDYTDFLNELYKAEQNALAPNSRHQTIQIKQNIEAQQHETENAEREVIKCRPYVRRNLGSDVQLSHSRKETTGLDFDSKIIKPTLKNTEPQYTIFIGNNEPLRQDKTTYCRPVYKSNKKQIVLRTVENRPKLQKLVKLLVDARRREKQKDAWDSYIWQLKLKHRISESDYDTQASLCKSFKQCPLPEKIYEELYSTILDIKPTVNFEVNSQVPSHECLHKMSQQRTSVTRQDPHKVKTSILKSKKHVSSNSQHFFSPVTSWKNYIHTALDTWESSKEDKITSSESEVPASVQSLSLLSVSLSVEKSNEVNVEKIGDHNCENRGPEREIQESSYKSISWKTAQELEDDKQYKFIKNNTIGKRDRDKKIWFDSKRSEIRDNTQTLKKVRKSESLHTKIELQKKDKSDLVKKLCHEPRRPLSNKKTYNDKKHYVCDITRSTDEYTSDSWSIRVQKSAQEPESSGITELTEKAEKIDDNLKSESEAEMLTPKSAITLEPSVVSKNRESSIRVKSSSKIPRDYVSVRPNCSTNEKGNCKVHLSKVEKQDEEEKLLCCRRRIQELLEQAYQGVIDKVPYSKDYFSETVKKEDGEIIISCKIRKPIKKVVPEHRQETPGILWSNVKDDKKQYIERVFLLSESLQRMRSQADEKSAESLPNDSSLGQSTTTQDHTSKIFQEQQFESKHTETERLNEEYCYCKFKLWQNSLEPQKNSENEISKTPQGFSTIYETNEDDIKETKSNTSCPYKNQQQELANRVKNSSHNVVKQPVQECKLNTVETMSSAIRMKMDDKTIQSLLSECEQTDDKSIDLEEILEEEINKSNSAKRAINEILGREAFLFSHSEVRLCMDRPTRDCCTKTTDSLGACSHSSAYGTKEKCTKTTGSLLETGRNEWCDGDPVEERLLTVAVNTDPLSFLALFELSKEAAGRLLSFARFTCNKMLPIPSPLSVRFPVSSYRLVIRNSDPVPQLASIQAWRRQQAEPNTSRSLPPYDCCVCRHLMERKQKHPVGIFICKYCGKGFIRAYCRDLHEQKCAKDFGRKHDLSLDLAILR